jgi:alkylation response protein AidB-like acyl-CoA dehydrogenase
MSAPVPSPIPRDCRGENFFRLDRSLQQVLPLYLDPELLAHLTPHLDRLGGLAGGTLDELAATADQNPPLLHPRDRQGRDEDWIEYHPAYRSMERVAFGEFQFHAMSHRGGVLGLAEPLPPAAKYAFTYLFVQAEFGLMCPISLTDTAIHLIRRHADPQLQQRLLPRMLAEDLDRLWKGSQFITEKAGGSDIGAIETVARQENGAWRLYGDKWFCSHADADVALLLARPEGGPQGTAGLGLFALTRQLEDGRRNAYRIVRLKDKLGTRSMASGEIRLEGAVAWPVGRLDQGLKQMLDQVNLSRLSHGVRAAAMMRRCLNEALAAARGRHAFGKRVISHPLMRRQLLDILLPTEQALSMMLFTADALGRAGEGSTEAAQLLRLLTPLIKFRACRDNVAVATAAMETRGGNGYIEEWVTARLVRDAHVGLLWEGTSNIIALDVVGRAIAKSAAHRALAQRLAERLGAVPEGLRRGLGAALDRAMAFAEEVSRDRDAESEARRAASALYDATTAILMAWEGMRTPDDARRLLLSRLLLERALIAGDPLARGDVPWQERALDLLLDEAPAPLAAVAPLLATS